MEKQEKRWMTAHEAAEYLSIHLKTLYELMQSHQLPAVKLKGIGWRIDRKRLDAMMEKEIEDREMQLKDLLRPRPRRL